MSSRPQPCHTFIRSQARRPRAPAPWPSSWPVSPSLPAGPAERQRRSPVLPAPLGSQGIPAGTPLLPSPALGRYGVHSIALGPARVRGVAQHPALPERAGVGGGRGGKECNAQTLRLIRECPATRRGGGCGSRREEGAGWG